MSYHGPEGSVDGSLHESEPATTTRVLEGPDLLALIRLRAAALSDNNLSAVGVTSIVCIVAAVMLSDGRYYLALPFLAALCFSAYGIAFHHAAPVFGNEEQDHTRAVDAGVVMKVAGLLGVASAVAALLCFFFLVLGPSWIS